MARKPVKREIGEKVVAMTITLPESDIAYLRTINPRNLSDAIRQVIQTARDEQDRREECDSFGYVD